MNRTKNLLKKCWKQKKKELNALLVLTKTKENLKATLKSCVFP